jgi:hypothetical protein
MALQHTTPARNAMAAALAAQVDVGTGTATLVILSATNVVLAEIALQTPAFLAPATGGAGAGEMLYAGLPLEDPDAVAAGVATQFAVRNRDGATVFTGTVGVPGSGEDLELSNVNIAILDAVRLNPGSGWRAPV